MSGVKLKWEPDKLVCIMSDSGMIVQSANEAIKHLEEQLSKGVQIPMSEFMKILIWEANNLKMIFAETLRKDKQEGWVIVQQKQKEK